MTPAKDTLPVTKTKKHREERKETSQRPIQDAKKTHYVQ
jgi:hypothetical protein